MNNPYRVRLEFLHSSYPFSFLLWIAFKGKEKFPLKKNYQLNLPSTNLLNFDLFVIECRECSV